MEGKEVRERKKLVRKRSRRDRTGEKSGWKGGREGGIIGKGRSYKNVLWCSVKILG